MTKAQKSAYRRRTLQRMHDTLTGCFDGAQLLTLYFSPVIPVPPEFEKHQYAEWLHLARRTAGVPFRYVKVTEYSPTTAAPVVAHRLFTDLPRETCEEIANNWFMGETTVETLNAEQLAEIAGALMEQPENGRSKGRRSWVTSQRLAHAKPQ